MINASTFVLYLKQKAFNIPSDFQYLRNISNDIFMALLTNKQYRIKSNVTEEVVQSFISYWINKKIPEITSTNIDQYDSISKEFDHMKNIIQTFRNTMRKNYHSLFANKNKQLKEELQKKKTKLDKKTSKYHKIIENLFIPNEINSNIEFLEINDELLTACEDENPHLVKIINQKEWIENNFRFKINEQEKTAGFYRYLGEESVYIQSFFTYKSEIIPLTFIYDNFMKRSEIKSVEFDNNSLIRSIGQKAFYQSQVESITLPASVERIGKKAFSECENLTKFQFKPNSQLKIIDVKAFASSSIEIMLIPNSVTHIKKSAFDLCYKLKKIEFSKHSNLQVIECDAFTRCSSLNELILPSCVEELKEGWCHEIRNKTRVKLVENAKQNIKFYENQFIIGKSDLKSDVFDTIIFADRNIKNAKIPPFIKYLAPFSFEACLILEDVIFPPNSELESFGNKAFFNSSIQSLTIPPKVCEFKELWCFNIPDLRKITVLPNNKHCIFLNDTFLIGKSDKNSDDYDVLLFAPRNIQKAVIPSFIKHIASCAFEYCFNLEDIIFSEDSQLVSIENYAFSSSGIRSVILPPNAIDIKEDAFNLCRLLERIDFPNNPDLFLIHQFERGFLLPLCSLSVPSNVVEFDKRWCFDFDNLADITVYITDEQNIIYYDNKFIIGKSDLKSEDYDILYFARRDINEAIIPSFIKTIYSCCFKDCLSLSSITFSEDSQLQCIDEYAFDNCSLQYILIPQNVTKIGKHAFSNCKQLAKVEFAKNSNLLWIDKSAFSNSAVEHMCFPSSVAKIGKRAFSECDKLILIEFEKNSHLKVIEEKTFHESSVGLILVPSSVIRIEKNAASFCQNFHILGFEDGSQIQSIGKKAFYESAVLFVSFPASLVRIGEKAFMHSKTLQTVQFAEDSELRFIDKESFSSSGIRLITFPKNVIKIGKNAFQKCSSLQSANYSIDSKLKLIDDYAFDQSAITNLYVPSNVEKISNYSFNLCTNLQQINFGDNSRLSTIGKSSFAGSIIEDISIPSEVFTIGDFTFSDCDFLQTVHFPIDSKLTTFSYCLFSNSSIENVDIPPSVEELEEDWCFGTPDLKNVTLLANSKNFTIYENYILGKTDNDSSDFDVILFANRAIKMALIPPFITEIASSAFNGCSDLVEVKFPKDTQLSLIDGYAFNNSSLRSITIPSTVKEIGGFAFSECIQLKMCDFEENSELQLLGIDLFTNSLITGLQIPPSVSTIREGAFANSNVRIIELHQQTQLTSFTKEIISNSSIEIITAPKELSYLFSEMIQEHQFQIVELSSFVVSNEE